MPFMSTQETCNSFSAGEADFIQSTTLLFREIASLSTIAKVLSPRFKKQTVQVASVGCSSGAEVYSLLLFNKWFNPSSQQMQVDGYDYNPENLELADKATFTVGRECERYIGLLGNEVSRWGRDEACEEKVSVTMKDDLRLKAKFFLHDITDMPLPTEYDIIMCANMLYHYNIFSNRAPLNQVLTKLALSIKDDGYLVAEGYSEQYMSPEYLEYLSRMFSYKGFIQRPDLAVTKENHYKGIIETAIILQKRIQ